MLCDQKFALLDDEYFVDRLTFLLHDAVLRRSHQFRLLNYLAHVLLAELRKYGNFSDEAQSFIITILFDLLHYAEIVIIGEAQHVRSLERLDGAKVRPLTLHGMHAEACAWLEARQVDVAWLESIHRCLQKHAVTLHAMLVFLTTLLWWFGFSSRNGYGHLVEVLGLVRVFLFINRHNCLLIHFLLGGLVTRLALGQEQLSIFRFVLYLSFGLLLHDWCSLRTGIRLIAVVLCVRLRLVRGRRHGRLLKKTLDLLK